MSSTSGVSAFLAAVGIAVVAVLASGALGDMPSSSYDPIEFCGPLVFNKVLEIFGKNSYDLTSASSKCEMTDRGTSFDGLHRALLQEGIPNLMVRATPDNLLEFAPLAIVPIAIEDTAPQSSYPKRHYVIAAGRVGYSIELWDPDTGWSRTQLAGLVDKWEGYAIIPFQSRSAYWHFRLFRGSIVREYGLMAGLGCVLCLFFLRQAHTLCGVTRQGTSKGRP